MKTIIAAVISLALFIGTHLMFQHTSLDVFALSDYQAGYNHGVRDGCDGCTHSDECRWYILEPAKGFAFHSKEFVRGYVDGFCSIDPNASSDSDQPSFDCTKGPDSASWLVDK